MSDYCSMHRPRRLGYVAWSEWADKQRTPQRQCPKCWRWFFRSEYGPGWDKARVDVMHDTPHGYQTADESAEEQR